MEKKRHYNVVCAVVCVGGRILCMRRPLTGSNSTAGKWEFPGGKIEPGETAEAALKRELLEEMDYHVDVLWHLLTVNYEYLDFSLTLRAYLCSAETTQFNRKEHIDHCWLSPNELTTLDWAAADDALIKKLISDHICTTI